MKNILILLILFVFNQDDLFSQGFSYIWPPTGQKIDLLIRYLGSEHEGDSTVTVITRKSTESLTYEEIDPMNTLIFTGNKIENNGSKVSVPLNQSRYFLVPFDPSVTGLSVLNVKHPELDTLYFKIGSSDFIGFDQTNPGGLYYWCSCNVSSEQPGDCLATLDTSAGGSRYLRCAVGGQCINCVGSLATLSNIVPIGGGMIIEVKNEYGYNFEVE
jgi:hypothetical protein